MKYPNMFSSGKIGNITLKNRVVMAPLAMGVAEKDQTIGDAFLEYLMERARGGVGMIIIENTRVDDAHGVAAQCQASVARDEHIAPLRRAVDAIHGEGTAVMVQLHHPGRETFSNLNSDEPVVSSGDRSCGVCQQETRALETAEVEHIVQLFVDGAVRAQKAGVDGVELHGAHGYLISQFLSPYTNQRTDKYGGSFEKRCQFITEIIQGIQAACGKDFPISVRLTVDELLEPNGVEDYLHLADGVKVCKLLESLGVAVINVSNGIYESFNSLSEPTTYAQGCRTPLIRAVKDAVRIPVIAVNMVKEPWYAEKMLEDGLVDFVGLGRAVVADPEWVKKAAEGRESEINHCISCTFCFETLVADTIAGVGPVKCAVNARAARELQYKEPKKDGAGRTVVIVGGGVAGLEAARLLAIREFRPVILEQRGAVGGQINIGSKPPHKEKMNWLVGYLLGELAKYRVDIRVNCPATVELIRSFSPHAVLLATGGSAVKPASIPGVDLPCVLTAEEALCDKVYIENAKVTVVGSGATGLETADFLCERGNQVTLVEMLDQIGKGVYVQHYLDGMDRLSKFDVDYKPSHKLTAVKKGTAVLENLESGKFEDHPADYVVLSLGVRSENSLQGDLEAAFDKVCVIGDAAQVGRIESAVRSGFETAWNL